jgi:SOS response regulatory protein OraA/RecX
VARKSANQNQSIESGLDKTLLKKAGSLLARRAHSRGELRSKLMRSADESAVSSVLDRLEQLNLLNDADYAYNFALYRMQHESWGPVKVHDTLLRRNVAPEVIGEALNRVRAVMGGEPDLLGYIRRFCGKHWPPGDARQLQRIVVHLRRRGFTEDSIVGALRRVISGELLQRIGIGE